DVDETASARFKSLHERDWQFRLEDFPGSGGRVASRMTDVSPAAQARRLEHWTQVRSELDAIDAAALAADERINFVIFRDQIDNRLADLRHKSWQMPMNSDSSF